MKILGKFKFLWGRSSAQRYESQRDIAHAGDVRARAKLAAEKATHPEILYYLSEDADETVRRAVARNAATPMQAAPHIARDKNPDVRLALAARLVELLPDISQDQQSQIYAFAVNALGTLAHDEVLNVRRALATALKDHALAPPSVVARLARDIEREVSEPILSFCVALSDDDLLDILSNHPEPWVVSAIARRPAVSDPVARGVVSTGDVPAGAALLRNPGARISEETLAEIVDRAREMPEWHEPLALRKEISLGMARHLAQFVDEKVLTLLQNRKDLEAETRQEIRETVQRRLEFAQSQRRGETPEQRAVRLQSEGRLDEKAISDALAWKDTGFVVQALGRLARIPPVVAEKILTSPGPKAIMALCWKAGLPARLAVSMQKECARIPPPDLLYPKDGLHYPLSEKDMIWQLELFGIATG